MALVLDLPADLVQGRNAARTARVVDRAVVERHLAAVRRLVDDGHLDGDGFEIVLVVREPAALDDLAIVRRSA